MSIELDHIFILAQPNAPEADLLVAAGLIEGPSNRHPGQGTSNRRFFFQNTTLEFLYVHDADEAANGPAKNLRFNERYSQADASPFGLIMRNVKGEAGIPYEGWRYCPDYFANNQCFHVGENSDILKEPLCICMPDNLPQRSATRAPENPEWNLTQLRIDMPEPAPSDPLQQISKCPGIVLELNKPHALELTFNHSVQGFEKDFRTQIPLVLKW